MTMVGMNLEGIRRTATALGRQAEDLAASQQRIDRLLDKLDWQGGDAQGFGSDWRTRHRTLMTQATQYLRDSANTLNQQAAQQETTSNSDGASPTFNVPSGPTPGNPTAPGPAANFFGDFANWTRDRLQDGADWGHDRIDDAADWTHDRIVDVGNGVNWAGQRIQEGAQWTGDRITDGATWLKNTLTNSAVAGWAGASRVANSEWGFWSHTASELSQWRLPQTAEIKAHLVLSSALMVGTAANVLTGTDQHIFAQGTGQSGAPVKAPQSSPPDGMSGLVHDMMSSYDSGGVQVKAIHDGNGHTTYVASIPGTDAPLGAPEGWTGAQNGRDWPANLWNMSTGSSAYTEAVKGAIDAAIARDQAANPTAGDAPPSIILAGHSQGGIIAANLASDPNFAASHDIRGIVAAGAPVECAEVPADVPVLSFQHGDTETASYFGLVPYLMSGDVVPSLDDGGRTILGNKEYHPNISTVITTPPGIDPATNHVQGGYELPSGFSTPQVSHFEQSVGLSDVYAGSGKTSDTYTVPIEVSFP